ncbi:uncharacterized protein VTP21DRAFT_8226 [Calcarisporiella thermophila]|uniref:uncharacterized protein n=1 Tax=Calcarisporiella thermophila TaxID=911321 RepID=UPI003742B640
MQPISLIQGRIALSFHLVSGEVVKNVLQQLGYDVEVQTASHEEMFERQRSGDIDILIGWLEGSHGKYLDAYRNESIVLPGPVYQPYCIWGVPEYVPEEAVQSVSDLLKPEVAEKMAKCIQGINPGAGISRFSQEIIKDYGLDHLGYFFQPGTEEQCFGALENAYLTKQWLVIPLWHPQFLHQTYKIRPLKEHKRLLRGVDQAQIIIHKSAAHKFSQKAIDVLSRIQISNQGVTYMDYLYNRKGLSVPQAAQKWISENQELYNSWFQA